jgi:phosphoserine phosphatase
MTSLTRIVLVRHGDVPGIAPPAFRGRTDLKLTARGIRQAEASRDRLASSFQFDSVYTSPLLRCVRTGDIIAEPHRPTPASLAGLTDIDYGAWQGRTYDEVQADQPALFEAWLAAPHLAAIPGAKPCTTWAHAQLPCCDMCWTGTAVRRSSWSGMTASTGFSCC